MAAWLSSARPTTSPSSCCRSATRVPSRSPGPLCRTRANGKGEGPVARDRPALGRRLLQEGPHFRMPYDLILRGGHVIDPSQGLDAVADVAFAGGKVARIGTRLEPGDRTDIRDVTGRIVT